MGNYISFLKQFQKVEKINPKEIRYCTKIAPKLQCPLKIDVADISTLSKNKVLAQYCKKNNYPLDLTIKEFEIAEKYLDKKSIQQLLKLTSEGKVLLMDKPKITLKKKLFHFAGIEQTEKTTILSRLKPIENEETMTIISPEESAKSLKTLLEYEAQGKIPAEKIASVLKMQQVTEPQKFNELMEAIESGKVNSKNINYAIDLTENYIPLKLLNAKSLDNLSKEELKSLNNILAEKGSNRNKAKALTEQSFRDKICELDTPILPKDKLKRSKLVSEISKKLTELTKVNTVSNSISSKFLADLETISDNIAKSKHSVQDLSKVGGVKLEYSRDAFKQNIFDTIKSLSDTEKERILEKFGLVQQAGNAMSGLPVYVKNTEGLTSIEKTINKEIGKFLYNNEVVLPKGFEEYQSSLDEICKTFPEFKFTIGSQQHSTHSMAWCEHILLAFQEKLRNPLYKELNQTDKRILGISTLLHDINKIEGIVDKSHALMSSKTANSIVQRMEDLSVSEKNRIINFVENHHWLEKISENEDFNEQTVKDLAYKFRSGNDFTMAKIFAESDLKSVNSRFFDKFGSKINSKMSKSIENEIINIQNKGRLIYTADVTAKSAIKAGAKVVKLGEGAEITNNLVISAKQLGVDNQNVLYHAPGAYDGYLLIKSGLGYGNEGVFSCSLGRNGNSAVFQGRKEFLGFRRPDMNKISTVSKYNLNSGTMKSYTEERSLSLNDCNFSQYAKKRYKELTSKDISDKDYALIFREIQNLKKPEFIHTNKVVQKILGDEKSAKLFEDSIIQTNENFLSSSKTATGKDWRFSEIVASDLEAGFLGTNRFPKEISYNLRKFCEENDLPIVVFD